MGPMDFRGGPMDGQSFIPNDSLTPEGQAQFPGEPAPDGDEGSGWSDDPVEQLRKLVEGMNHYMSIEQDDIDKAKAAKMLAGIQDLLAANQKQEEQALGTTPAAKYIARSNRGA